jgi:VWFA-related protein
MFRFSASPAVAFLLWPSIATPGGTQEMPSQATAEFRAGTAVVVLDLIVRDKKGRPVRDLKPGEIQVFENDEVCELRSFGLVQTEGTLEPPDAAARAGSPANPSFPTRAGTTQATRFPSNLVTLVFDRLDMEGQSLARKAALDFLERGLSPRSRVAVFKIGQRLAIVQDYTSEAEALRKAVEVATSGNDVTPQSLTRQATKAAEDYMRVVSPGDAPPIVQQPGDASEPSTERLPDGGRSATVDGRAGHLSTPAGPEAKFREVVARTLQLTDSLQRQMEGEWSLYPLLALVKAQERIPGRKTVLYFSSGLRVPPVLDDLFRSTIGQANRANVSVYAVDARGLKAQSDIQLSGLALRQAANASLLQQLKGADQPTTVDETRIMDTVDDSMRLNAQQTLSDLSEGTGGFLIANANDAKAGMDRVAADIQGYYEVSYVPPKAGFDGGFRKIVVKTTRKDVVLQSRAGYFALPPSDQIVLPFEVPLLSALSGAQTAHDFDYRARALRFGPAPGGVEHALIVEVPLDHFEFAADRKKKVYRLKLVVLAVVKDAEGRVVERFSDQYPLEGPLEQLDAVRQANAVLKRRIVLAAGHYTLESVAQVKDTGRASVERNAFEVPATGPGLALSSICLIRRADALPADAPPSTDPFRVEGMRVVPYLERTASKAGSPNLTFFARVYAPAGGLNPRLTLEFLRDGKVIGRAPPESPAPDASGRVAYVGSVPSAGFTPGAYEVRLTAAQGAATATTSTTFELLP